MRYDWTRQFSHVPPETLARFVPLEREGYEPILEQRGLPRQAGVGAESAENRVLLFDDFVLKIFRPGRWSKEALEDEVTFLEDLRDAGVPAVRPIGGIETYEGLHHLAYERVPAPYEDGRSVLPREDVERFVALAARVHEVGAQRPALHRPTLDPIPMGEDLLTVIDARGYLPASLRERYHSAVTALCHTLDGLLVGVPQQRVHADLGSWNVVWREEGPVLMDLDDFQMGPVATDLRLMSFPWRLDTLDASIPRRERRELQQELVLELYRKYATFEESWMSLLLPTSLARSVVFDAWFSHNWEEPGFRDHYEDDDITQEAYWLGSLGGIEQWLESV